MELTESTSETIALLVGVVVLTLVSVSANAAGFPFWQRSVFAVTLALLAAIVADYLVSTYLVAEDTTTE